MVRLTYRVLIVCLFFLTNLHSTISLEKAVELIIQLDYIKQEKPEVFGDQQIHSIIKELEEFSLAEPLNTTEIRLIIAQKTVEFKKLSQEYQIKAPRLGATTEQAVVNINSNYFNFRDEYLRNLIVTGSLVAPNFFPSTPLGVLAGDVTGPTDATHVAFVCGVPACALIETYSLILSATLCDVPSSLVVRDNTGSFFATTISLTGNSLINYGYDNCTTSSGFLWAPTNQNIIIGLGAGNGNTLTGGNNIAVGFDALASNESGPLNIAIGTAALQNNTVGEANIAIGYQALQNTNYGSGNDNIAIGSNALNENFNGGQNIALGSNTLIQNPSGSNNIAIGYNSGNNYATNESGNILLGDLGVTGDMNVTRIDNIYPTVLSGPALLVSIDANNLLGYDPNSLLATATPAAIPNTLVLRDATASFSACTITATCNFYGNLIGNASTATSAITSVSSQFANTSLTTVSALTAITSTSAVYATSSINSITAQWVINGGSGAVGTPDDIINTIVARDNTGSFSATTLTLTGVLNLQGPNNGNIVTLQAPATASYTLILPDTVGTSGQALISGISNPNQLSWQSITAIATGTIQLYGDVIGSSSANTVSLICGFSACTIVGTVTSATPNAAPNTLVLRDATGSFTACTITATCNFYGNLIGNASTATSAIFATTATYVINGGSGAVGTPDDIINTIVARDNTGSFSATTLTLTGLLRLQGPINDNLVALQAPATASYTLILPDTVGTSGQVLTSGMSDPNQLTWQSISAITTATIQLYGDVIGSSSANTVSLICGFSACTIVGTVTSATSCDEINTLVKRDDIGSFVATTITLTGDSLINFDTDNCGLTGEGFIWAPLKNNTLIGMGTGGSNSATMPEGDNTAVGYQALNNNINGARNTAIGSQALNLNFQDDNTAVGFQALNLNNSGIQNTAIGSGALRYAAGTGNIALGSTSGSAYTGSESNNILVGDTGTAGDNNVIRIGLNTIPTVSTFVAGIYSTPVTGQLVSVNIDGQLGFDSTTTVTPCDEINSIVQRDDTGSFVATTITLTGKSLINFATDDCGLTAQEYLWAPTNYNTIIGLNAAHNNLFTGTSNIVIGYNALHNVTHFSRNIALGESALSNVDTSLSPLVDNIAIGNQALQNTISANGFYSSLVNIAIGSYALQNNIPFPAIIQGKSNVAIGHKAIQNGSTDSIGIGYEALQNGPNSIEDVAIGSSALTVNSGGSNVAVGYYALAAGGGYNVGIGWYGLSNTSGYYNIGIGQSSGSNYSSTESYNIALGTTAVASDQSTTRIGFFGDTNVADMVQTQSCFIAGISGVTTNLPGSAVYVDGNGQLGTTPSSARYKTAIQDMGDATDDLINLRPVTFNYKAQQEGKREYGLIAEEVDTYYPDIVIRNKEGEVEAVQYQYLPTMILNEWQKDHKIIVDLKSQIIELLAQLNDLKTRIIKLEK